MCFPEFNYEVDKAVFLNFSMGILRKTILINEKHLNFIIEIECVQQPMVAGFVENKSPNQNVFLELLQINILAQCVGNLFHRNEIIADRRAKSFVNVPVFFFSSGEKRMFCNMAI